MMNRGRHIISILLVVVLCFAVLSRMTVKGEFEVPETESDYDVDGDLLYDEEGLLSDNSDEYIDKANYVTDNLCIQEDNVGEADSDTNIADYNSEITSIDDESVEGSDPENLDTVEEICKDEKENTLPANEQYAVTSGGIQVNASYETGVFPEDVTMYVADVTRKNAFKAASILLDDVTDAIGIDISFYDSQGYELQPADGKIVDVSLSFDTSVSEIGDPVIIHVEDDGDMVCLGKSEIESVTSDGVVFAASSFSQYVIAFTGGDVTIDVDGTKVTVNVPGSVESLAYMSDKINIDKNLVTEITITGDTSNVTDMSYMFSNCKNLTALDISRLDTSNVTSMLNMFWGCNSLNTLDVSRFDTTKVTNMSGMFSGCKNLTALDVSGFDTSNVTSMGGMFGGCNSLNTLDVSGFDTTNVTNMRGMFSDCYNLSILDVSGFVTSNVFGMDDMFRDCENLSIIDVSGFDTSNVLEMGAMFWGCKKVTYLDVSGFNTSKVNHMPSMFYECNSLKTLDVSGFDTSNSDQMFGMFWGCKNLTTLDVSGFDISKVSSKGLFLDSMFYGCEKLTYLDLSSFDFTGVSAAKDFLFGTKLLKIKTPKNLSLQIDLPEIYRNEENAQETYDHMPKISEIGSDNSITIVLQDITATGVSLNKKTASLFVGSTETLIATVTPENASDKRVSWSSNKTSVATVDDTGKVTAISPGTASITVKTLVGGYKDVCVVTVKASNVPVTGVRLNKKKISISRGHSEVLKATIIPESATDKRIAWSSNNPSVVTVNNTGMITGVASGTATITVTTVAGGYTDNCIVTVTDTNIPVTGISLNKNLLILDVNNDERLIATVIPENASNKKVLWTSSSSEIATVDGTGNVKALNYGTATITATTADGGHSAICKVTVSGNKETTPYNSEKKNTSDLRNVLGSGLKGYSSYYYGGSAYYDDDDEDDDDEDEDDDEDVESTTDSVAKPKLTKVRWQKDEVSTFYWEYSKKATGYKLEYSTDKNFKKEETRSTGRKKKEGTIKGLKVGKDYYVRVKAYVKSNGKKEWSPWSHRIIVNRVR